MSDRPEIEFERRLTSESCAFLRFLLGGSVCTFIGVSEVTISASVRGLSTISCVIVAAILDRSRSNTKSLVSSQSSS